MAVAELPHDRHTQRLSTAAVWDDLGSDLNDPEFRRAYASSATSIAMVDAPIKAKALALGQEMPGDNRCSSRARARSAGAGRGRSPHGHGHTRAARYSRLCIRARRLPGGDPRVVSLRVARRHLRDLTYCVRHRDEVNLYLADRAEQRAGIRTEVETRFPPEGLRAKLLARRDT